jgi:hypothetical protein
VGAVRALSGEDVAALLREYGEVYRLSIVPEIHEKVYAELEAAGALAGGRSRAELRAEANGVIKGKVATLRGVLGRLGQAEAVAAVERAARADVQDAAVRQALEARARAHVRGAHGRPGTETRTGEY